MKFMLLGAGGQLGRVFKETLPEIGEVYCFDRAALDITQANLIEEKIKLIQPDAIINAAAYTAVDKAETESELAFSINATAPQNIAILASKYDIPFIHYSTDYVFDGKKTSPYDENDKTHPINIYGESKLRGEQAIQGSGCSYLIFRTTWVIGQYGQNFAKTILRLAKEREELSVIGDQIGVPTTPDFISKVTISALKSIERGQKWENGIYNLVPNGQTSWFDIAEMVVQMAQDAGIELKIAPKNIKKITTAEYPTPAKRPLYSLLNNRKLQKNLDFTVLNWDDYLQSVIHSIINEYKK